MEKLTKDQAIVISAFTGYLVCKFSDVHADVEKRLGRPVYTHEFGDEEFLDNTIRAAYQKDFIALVPDDSRPPMPGGEQ